MTRHSKNCTAHSVYTYHERKKDQQEKGSYRLGKDSIKRFDCCCLTLQSAKDPVVTSDGFLYDRQAILEYIVSSKADIQRKLKLFEKKKSREDQRIKDIENTKRTEQLKSFLESSNPVPSHNNVAVASDGLKTAEGSYKPGTLSDFWSPGLAGSNDIKEKITEKDRPDTVVRCPMSQKPLKYKDLIPVNFCKYKNDSSTSAVDSTIYCCALTKDIITDATPCVVLKSSGSIITEEAYKTLISTDMKDPINGKKISKLDVIPLFRGSLGYTDERILLQDPSVIRSTKYTVIPVDPRKVSILETPNDFYQELIVQKLAKTASKGCHVTVLLEHTRSTRLSKTSHKYRGQGSGENHHVSSYGNSIEMLNESLLAKQKLCDIFLFHSPWLRNIRQKMFGDRGNEIFNLQHIKTYVFDDTVILSGANLSNDYFTNRQDRAWVIRDCPRLADYYSGLVEAIGNVSYRLDENGNILPSNEELDPTNTPLHVYVKKFKDAIEKFMERQRKLNPTTSEAVKDTILIPTIQMGAFDIHEDWECLSSVMRSLENADESGEAFDAHLVSGYFCPHQDLRTGIFRLLSSKNCNGLSITAASPVANGFLGSKGISGYIPHVYKEAMIEFLQQSSAFKNKINAFEYERPLWTFHAKGLWFTSPNSRITWIGSSNFNNRARYRDLESQVMVYTRNTQLMQLMDTERTEINKHRRKFKVQESGEIRLNWYLRFLMPVFRSFF